MLLHDISKYIFSCIASSYFWHILYCKSFLPYHFHCYLDRAFFLLLLKSTLNTDRTKIQYLFENQTQQTMSVRYGYANPGLFGVRLLWICPIWEIRIWLSLSQRMNHTNKVECMSHTHASSLFIHILLCVHMYIHTHIYIGRKSSINSLFQSSIKLIRTLPYYICAWNCEYVRTRQHVLGKFRTRHQKVS